MRTKLTGIIVLVFTLTLLYAQTGFEFGEPAFTDMDQYFIEHGQEETGGNNTVTDVVFDFRGFDTLGEATVLFTAVLGVGIIFRRLKSGEEYDTE